jgi:DNA-binding NtrC family response regulator
MTKILVVDDEKKIRNILKLLLQKEGYEVETAASGEEAILLCSEKDFDVTLLDLNLPGMDGLQTMEKIRQINQYAQHVFITAHGTVKNAVTAIKNGAYNFICKPFDNDELLGIISGAVEVKKLSDKVRALESQVHSDEPFKEIIGNAPKLESCLRLTEKVAPLDATVLISGESGTGKELLVRAIHRLSNRKMRTFIPVNCAAIPPNLFESEFFGHLKGSFTGASTVQKGKFREADGGTLFLDEIGEMPLEFQPKLLRALESGEVTPVGGSRPSSVNVRIIAATNKNIKQEVDDGNFREDLYYRLNIFTIELPPLRERRGDIPVLANYFVKKFNGKGITADAIARLKAHGWSGNIRQLKNEIQRAVILAEDGEIRPEHLSIEATPVAPCDEVSEIPPNFSLEDELKSLEQRYYEAAMKQTNGNKSQAAKLLGISYRTFNYQWQKIEKEE